MVDSSVNDIFLEHLKSENKNIMDNEKNKKIREGTIVAVNSKDVYIDLGDKSEVIIPIEEFETKPTVGNKINLIIKEMREGVYYASKLEADKILKFNEIKKSYKEGLGVSGKIINIVKKDDKPKGFEVDLGAKNIAFLPLSQIDTKEFDTLDKFIGRTYEFTIIEMNKNKVTISRKEYLKNTINKMYEIFFKNHKEGDVVKGKVEKVEEDYVILNTEGIRAFLHIADFSWKYLNDLRKYVRIGDELEVKIINIEQEKKFVKVSKKLLLPDPWLKVSNKYSVNDIVKAKVVSFKKNGAIVEIEDGVEGFIDTDEMSWTEKVRDPRKFLKKGMILEVKIKNIDIEKRKIDLSLREVQENPWDNADKNYPYGKKVTGRVTSIVDFGVFVKFDDGIEGLLRKEDVDWLEENIDLKKKFKKGQKIDVVVLSVDKENEKLRLGIKQLSENPYKTFSLNYPKGSIVSATVKEIQENGIVVNLENKLEGFIHISQIAKEKIEKIDEVLKVGDEIKAIVRNVDINKKKIELSRRDYLVQEEKKEVEKYIINNNNISNAITFGSLLKEKAIQLNIPEKKDNEKKNIKEEKKENITETNNKIETESEKTTKKRTKTTKKIEKSENENE